MSLPESPSRISTLPVGDEDLVGQHAEPLDLAAAEAVEERDSLQQLLLLVARHGHLLR